MQQNIIERKLYLQNSDKGKQNKSLYDNMLNIQALPTWGHAANT